MEAITELSECEFRGSFISGVRPRQRKTRKNQWLLLFTTFFLVLRRWYLLEALYISQI